MKLRRNGNDDHTVTSQELLHEEQEDQTRTARNLAEDAGYLRSRARLVQDEVSVVHNDALDAVLEEATWRQLKREALDLLNELAEKGYAWRDIARVVGVSVPALRKWRLGITEPSRQHRYKLAQVVALHEELTGSALVDNPPAWLEMSLDAQVPVTGLSLCADGRFDLVLTMAHDHQTPEEVLDEYIPDWRERYRTGWEVFEASDGQPAVRARGKGHA